LRDQEVNDVPRDHFALQIVWIRSFRPDTEIAVTVVVALIQWYEVVSVLERINAAAAVKVAAGAKLAALEIPTQCLPRPVCLNLDKVNEHLLHQVLLQVEVTGQPGRNPVQLFGDSMTQERFRSHHGRRQKRFCSR